MDTSSRPRPHTRGAHSSQSVRDRRAHTCALGPKGGLHTCSVLGRRVITRLLVSQSGKAGAPVLGPTFVVNLRNRQTQLQAKRRTRLSAPESTPPGPRAPVQLVRLGVLCQPLRGRAAARGKGPRLRNPARVLLPPRGQLLTNVPHPVGPLPGDSLPALAALPPGTPGPVTPPPAVPSRTRSIYHRRPRFRFPPSTLLRP